MGYAPLVWQTDFADTDAALVKLIALLSPGGMASFLQLEVGPYLRERAKQRFQDEGDDAVGDWAPLKDATVMMRESQNYPGAHPINHRTGQLENWVVQGGWHAYPAGYGGALQYPARQPSGVVREKVQTAQRGSASPLTVPRPVLAVSETDMIFVLGALAFTVQEAFK